MSQMYVKLKCPTVITNTSMRSSSILKYMEKCRIRYISQGTEKFTQITAKH
jgi:hypothetical protein